MVLKTTGTVGETCRRSYFPSFTRSHLGGWGTERTTVQTGGTRAIGSRLTGLGKPQITDEQTSDHGTSGCFMLPLTGVERRSLANLQLLPDLRVGQPDVPPLMYPHPELGCGGKLRSDDHRCRWPMTQCAVRSMVIVVSSPRGSQHRLIVE